MSVNNNGVMNKASYFISLLIIVFGFITTKLNGQSLNDEMKKSLRQSLIIPENKTNQQPFQHSPQIRPNQHQETLKVSPTTKLPSKGDQIQVLHPIEEQSMHINTTVTNSTPINVRPRGSVKFENNGKNMQVISTAGEKVTPSGRDFDPIRTRNRKRHAKTDRLVKAYNK